MNTPRELTCREAAALIFGARDRPLDPAEHAELDAHIAECEACAGARAQAEFIQRAMARWRTYRGGD